MITLARYLFAVTRNQQRPPGQTSAQYQGATCALTCDYVDKAAGQSVHGVQDWSESAYKPGPVQVILTRSESTL